MQSVFFFCPGTFLKVWGVSVCTEVMWLGSDALGRAARCMDSSRTRLQNTTNPEACVVTVPGLKMLFGIYIDLCWFMLFTTLNHIYRHYFYPPSRMWAAAVRTEPAAASLEPPLALTLRPRMEYQQNRIYKISICTLNWQEGYNKIIIWAWRVSHAGWTSTDTPPSYKILTTCLKR